jgi:hypothetical protein
MLKRSVQPEDVCLSDSHAELGTTDVVRDVSGMGLLAVASPTGFERCCRA